MPRAQVQPARDDMASIRLPEARSDRGVPRLKVVHRARPGDGCVPRTVLGIGGARLKEALESSRSVAAHARWARAPGSPPAPSPGSADVPHRATAGCDPERYGELVRGSSSSSESPDGLLGALEARMRRLGGRRTIRKKPPPSVTGSVPSPRRCTGRARTPGSSEPATSRSWRKASVDWPSWGARSRGRATRTWSPSPSPARVSAPTSCRRCAPGRQEPRPSDRVRRPPLGARRRRRPHRDDRPVDEREGPRATSLAPALGSPCRGPCRRAPRTRDVGSLPRHAATPAGSGRRRVLLGAHLRLVDDLPNRGRPLGPPLRGRSRPAPFTDRLASDPPRDVQGDVPRARLRPRHPHLAHGRDSRHRGGRDLDARRGPCPPDPGPGRGR